MSAIVKEINNNNNNDNNASSAEEGSFLNQCVEPGANLLRS